VQLPVTLRLNPSPILASTLVLAHGLAALGIVLAGMSQDIVLSAVVLLALSLGFNLRRSVFRSPVRALILKADGTLDVECRDGSCSTAQINPQTTVFPWLVALLLRAEGRNMALALLPDALGREGHRQLRLWLRWRANARTA